MLGPIKVADIELSQPLPTLSGLVGYMRFKGLVRLHGVPIGWIDVPIVNGQCSAASLAQAVIEQHSWSIIRQALENGLTLSVPMDEILFSELMRLEPPQVPTNIQGDYPLVTVVVCTRDRPEALDACLKAIMQLEYPRLDRLVIDNAPATTVTQDLIQTKYPAIRYIHEPRPGLDWARNRAIIEAKGEIIAYTDDDVIVDTGWVQAIARTFMESPEVMAVTGLVVPYELETEAQILFEMNGGFGKGFERKRYDVPSGQPVPWYLLGTGNCGTGANMAYRRIVFDQIGGFNPALDVGTVTNGAGDLEMFFRILKAGHPLIYEPRAMIRHCHRRAYHQLRTQLANNGSVLSYCDCAIQAYPQMRWAFLKLSLVWLVTWHCRRVISGLLHPKQFPLDLVWAELVGWFVGWTRYRPALKNAIAVAEKFASEPQAAAHQAYFPHYLNQQPLVSAARRSIARPGAVAVRSIDLAQPVQSLQDIKDYSAVRIFVSDHGRGLGHFDLDHQGDTVTVRDLLQAITQNLWQKLAWPRQALDADTVWNRLNQALHNYLLLRAADPQPEKVLPQPVPVTIIVGTCDRPEDLRNCLTALTQQNTARSVEIIVTDNHPKSGLTPPVVAEFPEVILVSEPRQGVAYARNAGIAASHGDIIITTDDDVTMSPDWLEYLIAPFARADVMAVTGNIVPVELEAFSQQLFESYGGLGRGFESFEVGQCWFERSALHVVPTWELGGTANAAFRAQIFHDRLIGLMDEALGPGMPSGVGEDIYLFYKILKAGYTMVYRGDAHVWHRHRRTMGALRKQLYNYSKGFVSYNLTTLLHDRDWRVVFNLGFYLPMYHLKRVVQRITGESTYPLRLIGVEVAGNLAGPWSLWRSRQRVKRDGRSVPYIPVQTYISSSSKVINQPPPTPYYASEQSVS